MISSLLFLIIQTTAAEAADVKDSDVVEKETVEKETVEKEIVYQKVTEVDMQSSEVKGEHKLPTEFFSYKADAPQVKSYLEERLHFGMSDFNTLGY